MSPRTFGANAGTQDPFGPARAEKSSPTSPLSATRRIEQALDQPLKTPLEFVATPLTEITQILANEYELPIVFDVPAIESVGSTPEVEVALNVRNLSLRSALALMLKSESLTYVIDNEVLLITTQQEASKRVEIRVYRVEDLQAARRSEPSLLGDAKKSPASLADVVARFVDRDSWAVNGAGEGEIEEWPGLLLVSNTSRVHKGIEQLLEKMRSQKQEIESSSQYRLNGPPNKPANAQVAAGPRAEGS